MKLTENRILGLDLFRAIAIVLVVNSHGKFIINQFTEHIPTLFKIDGVELFFVLSGFLIGSILIQLVHKNELNRVTHILTFWKRRWFRTVPNYVLMLIVNVILVSFKIIDGNIEMFNLSFFFFFQNFYKGFYDFYWESWSLSVEEYFYIFLPLLLFLFRKKLVSKKAILFTIIFLIVFPLIYRISISYQQVDDFWWDVEFRKVVLTRLDAIMYGVFMAFLNVYYTQFFNKNANLMLIIGLVLLGVHFYVPHPPNAFYTKTFYFSFQSFAVMLLIPKSTQISSIGNVFLDQFIQFISKISYSMYLTNLLLAQFIMKQVSLSSNGKALVVYIIYWVITILFSYCIYKYFEHPITQLRERK